jgi:hypothetical protein
MFETSTTHPAAPPPVPLELLDEDVVPELDVVLELDVEDVELELDDVPVDAEVLDAEPPAPFTGFPEEHPAQTIAPASTQRHHHRSNLFVTGSLLSALEAGQRRLSAARRRPSVGAVPATRRV